MTTITFQETQWSKIISYFRSLSDVRVGNETNFRHFLEGLLWVMRSGAQWRLLPANYGKWNSVYRRFARWSDKGLWQQMHQHFADDPDMEHFLIDSTVIRAHPCAAGAPKEKGEQDEQALGHREPHQN